MTKNSTPTTPAPFSGLLRPLLLCATTLLAASCVFMTQAIFLELAHSLAVEESRARLSFSVATLFYGLSFLVFGPAADRANQPRMASWASFCLAGAVFLSSWTHEFSLFIVFMGLAGVAASAIPAAMFPYMIARAPEKRLGVYLGCMMAAGTLGVVTGRFAVGLMTSFWGWEWAFRFIAGFALLCGLAIKGFLAPSAVAELGQEGKRLSQVLKPFRLMADSKLRNLLFIGFLLFFGFMGMVTFLTYYLGKAPYHFTAKEIGWVSLAGLTALLGAPISGSFSQRIGWFKVAFAGICLCLVSIQLLGWGGSLPLVVAGVLFIFLGAYMCQPAVFFELSQTVPPESTGFASSMYIFFCIGGSSVASTVLGPVWTSRGWAGITLACSASLIGVVGLMIRVRGLR